MDSIGEVRTVGKTGVGVLDKAVGILSFLAEDGPASLAGVVRGTGLARPTAYRLLSALEAHGLVAREGGRYLLGLRLLSWGGGAVGSALVGAATPVLEALRDRTGESTQLYVKEGDRRVCVASVERTGGGLRDAVPVGAVLPLGHGSGGKVLRVWSEGADGGPDAGDLAEIRAQGWAESVAEREAGVASVSAPVFGPNGGLRAAVCASGPISRLGEHPGERLADLVVEAAREIETAQAR
ncbi:MAG: Transcriptional regulator, IclR family [uncultured Rubrobacteraceae bacterium]|jgi:DNA-binding IclR family transcriptional regulator|uniref:Transcriptional regulator, IclR family n=1 Tax=uncultured Rubrobacteraceae bacterium TaxID=349277 RepID=A0A6J4NM90_9ACTN|nr:MAG: Transcriptional regulator, IclR family [uncultured Rubrobacteraceae bacterium]